MKKFISWLQLWLPGVWSILGIFIITGLLVASSIWVVQWIFNLMGVM